MRDMQPTHDRALWAVDMFKLALPVLRREPSGRDLLVQERMIPLGNGKAPTGTPLHTALEATSLYLPHIHKGLLRSEVLTRLPHRPQGTRNVFLTQLQDSVKILVPVLQMVIHRMGVLMIGWILKFEDGPGQIALARTTSGMMKTIADRCSL
jgi:hypothetical protein